MKEQTARKLADLGTAALGVACIVVAALVPATAPVLWPLGGTLIGMPMRRPSDLIRKRIKHPDEGPTPPPVVSK